MPVWEELHCYTHACSCPQVWLVLWARTGSLGLRATDLHSSFLRWQNLWAPEHQVGPSGLVFWFPLEDSFSAFLVWELSFVYFRQAVWRKKLWAVSGNCSETLAKIISPPRSQTSPWWNSGWFKSGIRWTVMYWVLTMCWAAPCWAIYTLSWLILLQPLQVGLFLASFYGWGKPRLREVKELSLEGTQVDTGWARVGSRSEPFRWYLLRWVWEDSKEKGPPINFQPFKKPRGILTFILEKWILAEFRHFITHGNLILAFIDIDCFFKNCPCVMEITLEYGI